MYKTCLGLVLLTAVAVAGCLGSGTARKELFSRDPLGSRTAGGNGPAPRGDGVQVGNGRAAGFEVGNAR